MNNFPLPHIPVAYSLQTKLWFEDIQNSTQDLFWMQIPRQSSIFKIRTLGKGV